MTELPPDGVALPDGHSGSSFFHHALAEAVGQFGEALDPAGLPGSVKAFKADFGDAVARFEAARVASPDRVAIADRLARTLVESLRFGSDGRFVPLVEHLAGAGELEVELQEHSLAGTPGLAPEVPFDGRSWRGDALRELGERLHGEHKLTRRALEDLRWVVDHAAAQGGALDLTGHRFAVLGAGAELAPTELLLRAGATVLWVDLAEPGDWLARLEGEVAGTLVQAPGARDLLREPARIAAAVRRFAAGGPVHLGMFAYAPGSTRELRLAGTMVAIARSLDPEMLASIGLYISPTTPRVVCPGDRRVVPERRAAAPRWQRALERARILTTPPHHVRGDVAVARSVISLQGTSYQAAQYLAKVAAAESLAVGAGVGGRCPVVSANVAGITSTSSLQHPLFQAAFAAAPRFGIEIFEPPTTRALSALLLLRDVLDPGARPTGGDVSERATELLSAQVHGGVYTLPWVFESAVRVAAVVGLVTKPRVLLG